MQLFTLGYEGADLSDFLSVLKAHKTNGLLDVRELPQTLAHYEVGRLRIAAAMLPALAKEFDVTVEELLGEPTRSGKHKRGPTPKLQRQLEQISRLPRAKQRFVIEMLDTVLQKTG